MGPLRAESLCTAAPRRGLSDGRSLYAIVSIFCIRRGLALRDISHCIEVLLQYWRFRLVTSDDYLSLCSHHHPLHRHFGSRGGFPWPRIALSWIPQGIFSCFPLYYCVSPEVRQEYLSYVTTFWISGVYSSRTSIRFVVASCGTARQYAKRGAPRIWPIGKACILRILV